MNKPVYKLVDLSKWNGNVDFAKVKAAGIDGVIIRTGFGVKNPKQIDNRFEEYYRKAKAAGLYVGAYHYSYAKSASDAENEAEFMLEMLKGKSFELPIYGDFEEQGKLSAKICNDIVNAFCGHLEAKGAWAGVYSYDSFFRDKLSTDIPKRYTTWVARVENVYPKCVPAADIGIWQYSWKGHIDGIKDDVDMDYCYRDFPKIIKSKGLNGYTADKTEEKPSESTDTTPKGTFYTLAIKDGTWNVRKGANVKYAVVKVVKQGEKYMASRKSGNWYYIDKLKGWISASGVIAYKV